MLLHDVIEKDLNLPRQVWIKDPLLVRTIQLRLFDAGLLKNDDVTGIFDQKSEDALKRFIELIYIDSENVWVLDKRLANALTQMSNQWRRYPEGSLMRPKRDFPFELRVPYFQQRGKACVSASNAMLLKFLRSEAIQSFQDYAQLCTHDDADHHGHTKILDHFGIRSEWRPDLSFEDLNSLLDRGIPAVISVQHLGGNQKPKGGHTLVVVGRDSEDTYICHDPLGFGFGSNYRQNPDGKSVIYSQNSLNNRWLVKGQPDTGWGRIVFEY